jgi:Sulfotransferase domain
MRSAPAPMPRGWLSDGLRARFDPVAVILSPPRSGSTVLARSLWQHARFRYYLHEPFDRAYHDGCAPSRQTTLGSVLDRGAASGGDGSSQRGGIVIKEMTFQARELAAELIDAATLPVILLIRDPRLALSSRMRRLEADGQPPDFPVREAGWRDFTRIHDALRHSRTDWTDYTVVDISHVRRHPSRMLAAICSRLGLPWDERMLSWPDASGLRLGQIGGRQDNWYQRVLSSTGFQPPTEEPPDPDYFRSRSMVGVLAECLDRYREAQTDTRFLDVAVPAAALAPGMERWP